MKRPSKISLAIALLGSAFISNAADLTANTTIKATVVEPSKLSLTYTEGAPLNIKDGDFEENVEVGYFDLSGYKPGTSTADVNFTDATGEPTALTLHSLDGNYNLTLKIENGDHSGEPNVNNQIVGLGYGTMTGEKFKFRVLSRLPGDDGIIAGKYSDAVTLTVSNQ
ncbi:hypothetical protein F3V92_22505 [Salmonella enterica]|nr:hypothetical protein [Salmonella enterica]ECW2408139.1 hypothetical protein [Salmonella enterica]EDV4312670.1 hypothetical protein [Salmonella enterica subsp. enterica]